MAPRKGMFGSNNKVKPFVNKERKFNSDKKTFKPKEAGNDKKDDFFVRPGTSGSTQTREYSKNKNIKPPSTAGKTDKKPFDKKKWRLQRYSNKYKVQQWEDKRKKVVMREYYKQIDDRPKFDVKKIYEAAKDEEEDQDENEENNETIETDVQFNETREEIIEDEDKNQPKNSSFRKKNAHFKVRQEFERMKEEKARMKEEARKKKEERTEALKAKKEERVNKFKKLNKRTKKGQPIMKDRMEMLLEQIQKNLQK